MMLVFRLAAAAALIGACAYFARELDWSAVRRALAHASLPLVALAVVVNLFQVWLCAAAWSLMLSPVARVPVGQLFRYTLVAFAASGLLPGRSGEVIRAGMLKANEGVPLSIGAALSIVEKCIEAITLLILAAPLPLLLPALPRWVSTCLAGLGAVGFATLALVWLAASHAERLSPRLARFAEGARVVRDPRVFFGTLAIVLLQWLTDAATLLLVMRALGIRVHWSAPILVDLLLNMAILVPLTPAQVGVFEVGIVTALGLLGVGRTRAVAFALLYHALEIVPTTAFGLIGLATLKPDARRSVRG